MNKLKEISKEYLEKDKTGHDWEHIKRVHKNAMLLAKFYPNTDLEILEASVYLHDIAFKDGFVKDHHIVGAKQAKAILEEQNFSKKKISAVCNVIELHCGTLYGEKCSLDEIPLEAKILRDADNLDAVGSIGLIRMINFCNSQGFPLFKSRKDGLNESVYGGVKIMTTYPEKMLTEKGKELCKRKTKIMLNFLKEIEKEFTE
jgi:uncharacterized protein